MTLYPKLIRDILATVIYPGTKKNLVESGMVADNLRINGNSVSFSLIFPRDTDPFIKSTVKSAEATLKLKLGDDVEVKIGTEFKSAPRPEVEKLLPDVKNIIAVSSGKGGVGKSTVSANLAIALARLGYKVGLLDTDIFGPSLPKMFGVEDARPYGVKKDGRDLIEPIEKYGVKMLSIGFFVNPDTATLWRGGMATAALKQLIADADWGDLDYFVLDTPPGTSDIHLTLLQTLAAHAGTAAGAFAEDDDGPQPLVALWQVVQLRDAAGSALASGRNAVHALQSDLGMTRVRLQGVRFGNLNTFLDLAAAGFDPA